MKKALLVCVLAFLGTVAYLGHPVFLRNAFYISGVIRISPELINRASRPNTVLFIIAKNVANIPVAVKRIVNPVFPIDFRINSEDLLLPDPWRGQLYVEVQLNDHGQAGHLLPGNMTGTLENPVYLRRKDIDITIDKVTGLSSLRHVSISKKRRRGRGDRMFDHYPSR